MCPPLLAVTLRKSRLCTLLPSSIKWGHHPHCRDCWEDTRRAGTHGRVPTMYPDTASTCLPSRPSSRLRGRPPTGVRVGHRGCLSLGLSLSTHRSQGSLQLPPTPPFVPRLSWFVPSPNILQERLGPRPPCSTRESCLLGTGLGPEAPRGRPAPSSPRCCRVVLGRASPSEPDCPQPSNTRIPSRAVAKSVGPISVSLGAGHTPLEVHRGSQVVHKHFYFHGYVFPFLCVFFFFNDRHITAVISQMCGLGTLGNPP